MSKDILKQDSLSSSDLLLLLYLATITDVPALATTAKQLLWSPSQVHQSMNRCVAARLMFRTDKEHSLNRANVRQLVLGGAAFVFPPRFGTLVRGTPTSNGAAPLQQYFSESSATEVLVWPNDAGPVRGVAIAPLHWCVPLVVGNLPKLYELVALFDGLRAGDARVRELARQLLEQRL